MANMPIFTKCSDCSHGIATPKPQAKWACEACWDFSVIKQEFLPYDLDVDSYRDYLRSEHWSRVRDAKINSVGGSCACCGSTLSLHVHHREYPKSRIDIKPQMLVVLCKRCHEAIHDVKGKSWVA